MILLWGLPQDNPLIDVCDALARLGARILFLDQRRVLELQVEMRVAECVQGVLHDGARTVDLAELTAAYLRPDDARRLPSVVRAGLETEVVRRALDAEDVL